MSMARKKKISTALLVKADNAKTFALTMAYIQVIGRSINGKTSFSTDDVRLEIESSNQRYGKLDKAWLAAHLGNMTKSWIAQGKIARTDKFTVSRYNSAPLPLYVGIDNSAAGLSFK